VSYAYDDTMYDGFGSVVRQYESYRSIQGANTETTYDALGRPVSIASSSDGATTRMGCILNQTYVRDPAGKWRRNTTDALGRLTEVKEDVLDPPASLTPVSRFRLSL